MNVRVLDEAAEEIEEARQFLADRAAELGSRFIEELSESLQKISGSPEQFPRLKSRGEDTPFRRMQMKTFQYFLLFELLLDAVVVLSLVHVRRAPHEWLDHDHK